MSAPTTFQKLLDDEVLDNDNGDSYRAKNSGLTGEIAVPAALTATEEALT